jgi:cold shock CspA family protein/ribosome-associated translation inhibitor RaiA
MQIPVQIVAQGLELTPELEQRIRRLAAKLETFFARLLACRVAVSVSNRWARGGPQAYRVRIDLTVPRGELVVKRPPRETLLDAIQDAFHIAGRRLQDYARELPDGAAVEERAPPARGRVSRLFPWEGYGFLETPDGREVYFHRNSVLRGGFDRLATGTRVRFTEEEGDHGPQASTVEAGRLRRSGQRQGLVRRGRTPVT